MDDIVEWMRSEHMVACNPDAHAWRRGKAISDVFDRLPDLLTEVERLREKNAALVEALHFYASNHYPDVNSGPWGVNSADFGDVARAALAKVEGGDVDAVFGIERMHRRIDDLATALRALFDEQNGPPLLGDYAARWEAAMEKARHALIMVEG